MVIADMEVGDKTVIKVSLFSPEGTYRVDVGRLEVEAVAEMRSGRLVLVPTGRKERIPRPDTVRFAKYNRAVSPSM
jgi:hypothetical protein